MLDIKNLTDIQVLKELERLEQRKKQPIKGTYAKSLKQDIFEEQLNPTTELENINGIYVPIVKAEHKTQGALSEEMIKKLLKSVKNPRQKQIIEEYVNQQKQISEQQDSKIPISVKEVSKSIKEPIKEVKSSPLAIDNKPYGNKEAPSETVEELKERMTSDKKKLQYLTTGGVKPKEQPKPESKPKQESKQLKEEPILIKVTDEDEEEDIIIKPKGQPKKEELPELPEKSKKATKAKKEVKESTEQEAEDKRKELVERLRKGKEAKAKERAEAKAKEEESKAKPKPKEEEVEIEEEEEDEINPDEVKEIIKHLDEYDYDKSPKSLKKYLEDNDIESLLKKIKDKPEYKKLYKELKEEVDTAKKGAGLK